MKIIDYLGWQELPPHQDLKSDIVIHHALASKASVQDIERWHKEKGWRTIGYAEYITKDGTVYLCRKNRTQAANYGYNTTTYNICLEGNYNIEIPPHDQLLSLANRIKARQSVKPNGSVKLHRDYGNTATCPGTNFDLDMVLDMLSKNENKSWTDILQEVSTAPEVWEKKIKLIKRIVDGNWTTSSLNMIKNMFPEFSYLPLLIEKAYNKK